MLGRAPWICRARGCSRAGGGNQGRQLTLYKEDLPWLANVAQQPFLHSAHPKKAPAVTPSSRIAMMTYDPPATLSAASMHGLNCSISVLSLSHHFLLRNKGAGFDATFKALASYLLPSDMPILPDHISDDASSTSSNPASQCSKTREKSAGQESGFQSSASLASHSPPGLRPLDHQAVPPAPESLASGVSSLHLPSLGPRRSSIGHLRPSSAASSRTAAARRSAR